jgi:hypothetical protein
MPDSHQTEVIEVDRPMSISHFVHTLHAYAPAILLSLAAIAVLYVIVAVALYVFSPAQRVTTQQFRLDFEGAAEGRYPNGIKFSSSDITSTPILLKVYQENHLDRFTNFLNFSRAIFVLESNLDYERLAADYQARLSDPKLSAIDRERMLREWQSKAAAINKNEYSLNWLRTPDSDGVPESLVKKVLLDTLTGWARYAATEQHVLKYRLTVFSPQIIDASDSDGELIVDIQMLRSKVYKILQNIDLLREVPGAELVRSADGRSLEEIRLRLEEIVRFRLEPLTGRVSAMGLIANRPATVRFIETQLAYDQRYLKATQDYADTIRQSFAVYSDQPAFTPETASAANAATRDQTHTQPQRSDTLMPQISESFLDRLMTLTSQASDVSYRQKLVDDYRRASQAVIPAQQSLSYDQEVLGQVKSSSSVAASGQPAAAVSQEIVAARNEVKELVGRVNNIYDSVSSNLSPSKELYTLTAPPLVRTERSRSLMQLLLYGVALLALSLPVIIVLCLLHARVREEEASEPYVARSELTAV